MDQVVNELERFEERPHLDTRGRYGSLLKRFEQLEKLYYNLRRKQAPNLQQLVERILAEQSARMTMQPCASTLRLTNRQLVKREDGGMFPLYGA
jgi:hypothetical protein